MKSKEAVRRKQLKAQKRKRQSAEKAKAKKQKAANTARMFAGFEAVLARWQKIEEHQLPREEPCFGGCGGAITLHAHGRQLVHLHSHPECEMYLTFRGGDEQLGPAGAHDDGGLSIHDFMSRTIPEWAHGPSTELTEEQGYELLDSGEVLDSCQIMSGMLGSTGHARTKDGLFHWNVTVPDVDDEDDEFDDETISEVKKKALAVMSELEASPPDVPGWKLVDRIGGGGFARVWYAEPVNGSEPKAIKTLRSEHVGKRSLLSEWDALNKVSHPGVVRAHQADANYLVMDYHEGLILSQELREDEIWSLEETVEVLGGVCDALGAVHAAGLAHDDVNPSNILLAPHPILIDFGCATPIGQPHVEHERDPRWMSPEAIQEKPAAPTSDLWAIPLLALAMLTGLSPVDEDRLNAWAQLRRYDGFPTPTDPNLPPGFDLWWRKATDPDPAKRYQTAAEMKRSLRGLGRLG